MHILYKQDQGRFREVIETIKYYSMMLLKKKIKLLIIDDLDEYEKSIYYHALESIVNETDMLLIEELACDFQSFIRPCPKIKPCTKIVNMIK
jgi:hypothetical protein